MRNAKLMTGVALAALWAGASGAFAVDVGDITQSASQTAGVSNTGQVKVISLNGDGSSASVSATGALSAVSVNGIGVGADDLTGDADIASDGGGNFIRQETTVNTSAGISNTGFVDVDGSGNVAGDGASASLSATGAASAVSSRYIGSTGNTNFGDVTQTTTIQGGSDVTNSSVQDSGDLFDPFGVRGDGASVSASATGAVSSVSLTGINSNINAGQSVGNIRQTTTTANGTDVSNGSQPNITKNVEEIRGDGASASVSATGAASSVSVTQIGAFGTDLDTEFGNVRQDTTAGDGDVSNFARKFSAQPTNGLNRVSGTGASASISATGAVSAVAATYIETGVTSETEVGNINQTTLNRGGTVSNVGEFGASSGTILSGDGASISISATGAASAVSATFINSAEYDEVDVGNIRQDTTNNAEVSNTHGGNFSSGTLPEAILSIGNITGDGASVSISATGAASSVSLTSINNFGAGVTPDANIGNVTQDAVNRGDVTNEGRKHPGGSSADPADSVINTGNISGTAASVSISATGAVAALSVTSINDTQGLGSTNTGNINQTASNSGNVTNFGLSDGGSGTTTGVINAGTLSGAGTSASVSATGAAASASFSAID